MPGKYRPTPTHSFVKLLHNRSLLQMCYTQNIDTLERMAGVPEKAVVEAHGSFANQHCIECGSGYDQHTLKDEILRGEVARCDECGGLVKPDIVFFGESVSTEHKRLQSWEHDVEVDSRIHSCLRNSITPTGFFALPIYSSSWAHR